MRHAPSLLSALLLASAACGASADHGGSAAHTSGAASASAGTGASSATGAGATTGTGGEGSQVTYGAPYTDGQFNLGPVDYAETQFHNACAPGTKYDPRVQSAEGLMLAGLWDGIPNVANYCDACIQVQTAKGKSALLRVVTYGQTSNDSIDTSPDAFHLLDSGEYPRAMIWQLARCPDTGPMIYEFQSGANEWWTSLWVRNARVPLAKVEVESANHASWTELARGGDGTLTDAGGFGAGKFSLRSTGVDGQAIVEAFDWPSGGVAGAFLEGTGNFQ